MFCFINKVNGTTHIEIYFVENEGQRLETGKCIFYPSQYKVVDVTVRKGKVTIDRNWRISNLLKTGSVDVPEWLAEHPVIKELTAESNAALIKQYTAIGESQLLVEEPVELVLSEKGDTWTVVCKPAEVWLEWGLGKGWYEVENRSAPHWAVRLRAFWDSAYA